MRSSNGWKISLALLIVGSFVLTPFSATGTDTASVPYERVDQEWWDGYSGTVFNCGCNVRNNSLGQSFIPTQPVLSSIDLYLTFVRPEGIIELWVYKAKENGYPDLSNSLAYAYLEDEIFLPSQHGAYNFDFEDILVEPGDTYFIILQSGTGWSWRDTPSDNDGNYPNGSAWSFLIRDDFGYEKDWNDFLFRTYYSDTAFPPVAVAESDGEAIEDEIIMFLADGSYDPDGEIVAYEWDFGDETTGTGIVISHSYSEPGTYIVNLTVTDNDGLMGWNELSITVEEEPGPVEIPFTGYTGHYYNLPANHSEVEGPITGVVPGDSPFNHDWYDEQYYSFTREDANLTFGQNFFPVDDGLPEDPYYFAVHWEGTLNITESGTYSFELGSDDDSWVYVDDEMVVDLGGVHAYVVTGHPIYLEEGVHIIDIYFAERHKVQSGFYFEIADYDSGASRSNCYS